MSVQSQIDRIEQNVAAAYAAAAEQGASMPTEQNSNNLAGTIFTIPKSAEVTANIPSYWQTVLDAGVAAINTAIETAGRNKSAFLFYTDAHWGYGSGMSPALLKYLGKHTAMNKTIFGGDISNGNDISVLREWRLAVREIANHHSVIGNHDTLDLTAMKDEKEMYGFLMAPEETADIIRGGDFYYYIDEPSEKTRYLFLSTGRLSVSDEETAFVVDALSSAKDGWHIVVISHIWFLYNNTSTPTVGSTPSYCQKLLDLFDAYNNKGSGSITMNASAIVYDFQNAVGRVEFCIGGHIHVDLDLTSAGGIPVLLIETDSYHVRSGLSATAGTTGEASVNGIIADYSNHKIHVVRIGRGVSRDVEITNYEVSYTNVLPSAKAADGITVYNGVGYKAGVRWSSSGNNESTSNASDLYLTGYIPVTKGDVVYMKNVTMNKNNSNTNACAVHHFATLADTNEGSRTASAITNYMQGVWDADGNLIQFTIPYDSENFIRLQGTYFGSDSIITVNEVIE